MHGRIVDGNDEIERFDLGRETLHIGAGRTLRRTVGRDGEALAKLVPRRVMFAELQIDEVRTALTK